MERADADRDLLVATLATQAGFVTPEALSTALEGRSGGRSGLAEALVERGALGETERALLESLAEAHLARHGGDPGRSLALLSTLGTAREAPGHAAGPTAGSPPDGLFPGAAPARIAPALGSASTLAPASGSAPTLAPASGSAPTDPLETVADTPSGDGSALETVAPDSFATDPGAEAGVGSSTGRPAPGGARPAGSAGSGPRFRILRFHARGGLGEVYVARDAELNRKVALKEIRDRRADDPTSRARFLVEAEITGGLEHPGIVPVYGLGVYPDGRPFYAMRFIRGDNLKQAIARHHDPGARGGDPGPRALEFRGLLGRFVDVCEAIAYSHSKGVLHRDLKPENVMLGRYGETLVVDWGLAKASGVSGPDAGPDDEPVTPSNSGDPTAATRDGSVVGTPAYMSPEQALGEVERLGPSSDVYGLGAILYTLLTGRAPATGRDLSEVLDRVARGAIEPPRQVDPSVSPALEAICRKAMAVDPSDRYAAALELAGDVERWLADEPVSAYREPIAVRLGRWARRHRPLVAGAATLTLTLLMALAVGTGLIAREQRRTARERDLAERYYRQARGAVDRFLTRVGDNPQLELPGLQPLRRALLADALAYYQGFADQPVGDDPELRAELADAYRRVASINAMIGRTAAALEASDRARALFAALIEAEPGDPGRRFELAALDRERGKLLLGAGRADEAGDSYRASLEALETLADAAPDDPEALFELAETLDGQGDWHSRRGRNAEALDAFRRALGLRLRAEAPDARADAPPRLDLAGSHRFIANVHAERRDFAEAIASAERARAILEPLAAGDDPPFAALDLLGQVDHQLGAYRHAREDLAGAEADFRRALEARRRLVETNTVARFRNDEAKDLADLGVVLRVSGRLDEARAALTEALTIRESLAANHGDVLDYRRRLAESLSALGDLASRDPQRRGEAMGLYERAREILEPLIADDPGDPSMRHHLSVVLAGIGATFERLGALEPALESQRSALELREGLVAEKPDDAQNPILVANTLANVADLLGKLGRHDEERAAFERSRDVRLGLLRERPEDLSNRSTLALTLHNYGTSLLNRGLADEAAEAYRQAIAQQREAARRAPAPAAFDRFLDAHHDYLGRALRAAGRPAEAAEVAEDRLALRPDDPAAASAAARDLARCLPLVAGDAPEAAAERDRIAVSALDALRQAIASGADPEAIRSDEALAPLRSDDRFERLFEEDGAEAPPRGEPGS